MSRIEEIQKELQNLPFISIYDENGEIDEDAYQEKLEQSWYKEELQDELKKLKEVD